MKKKSTPKQNALSELRDTDETNISYLRKSHNNRQGTVSELLKARPAILEKHAKLKKEKSDDADVWFGIEIGLGYALDLLLEE